MTLFLSFLICIIINNTITKSKIELKLINIIENIFTENNKDINISKENLKEIIDLINRKKQIKYMSLFDLMNITNTHLNNIAILSETNPSYLFKQLGTSHINIKNKEQLYQELIKLNFTPTQITYIMNEYFSYLYYLELYIYKKAIIALEKLFDEIDLYKDSNALKKRGIEIVDSMFFNFQYYKFNELEFKDLDEIEAGMIFLKFKDNKEINELSREGNK